MLIRRARLDDAAAIARVHVESWRATYRGIVPAEYLAALSVDGRIERWRRLLGDPDPGTFNFVAQDEHGEVSGFASGGPRRQGHERYAGELYAIYLSADHQRAGVGRALTAAVAGELLSRGMPSMLVWVLADNPARGFYEALGGHFAGQTEVAIGGATLTEVAYAWDELAPLIPSEPD